MRNCDDVLYQTHRAKKTLRALQECLCDMKYGNAVADSIKEDYENAIKYYIKMCISDAIARIEIAERDIIG